jgi:hypothetical protein
MKKLIHSSRNLMGIRYNCFKFATFKMYKNEGDFFKIEIGFKNL